jgi:hypothetical protein
MCKATGFLPKFILFISFTHQQKINQKIMKKMKAAQWLKGTMAHWHILDLGLDRYQIKKESISLR